MSVIDWWRAGRLLLLLIILPANSATAQVNSPTVGDPIDQSAESLCDIFRLQPQWRGDLRRAQREWGSPRGVIEAFIYQESRFRPEAIHPTQEPNSDGAYGYSQAIRSTWDFYRRSTGNRHAQRDNFSDSVDFVGWYNKESRRDLNLGSEDAYNLYLAYHEGWTGFRNGSYDWPSHVWIQEVAHEVAKKAKEYRAEYESCGG